MSDCPDVDTPWGEPCRTCGQRLPKPLPLDHGRPCSKPFEFGIGSAGLSSDTRWTEAQRESQKGASERQRLARANRANHPTVIPRSPVGGWGSL